MDCKCGYSFVKARMAKKGATAFVSYALVNDKDYKRLMRAEMKVLQTRNRKERLTAIAKSARFVGTLMECPQCHRFVMNRPDAESTEYYRREK